MKRTAKGRRFVERVGGRIRDERKRQKLTQGVLAKRIGADVPTMSRIESGERDLRMSELFEAGNALGVPPRQLVDVPLNGNSNQE